MIQICITTSGWGQDIPHGIWSNKAPVLESWIWLVAESTLLGSLRTWKTYPLGFLILLDTNNWYLIFNATNEPLEIRFSAKEIRMWLHFSWSFTCSKCAVWVEQPLWTRSLTLHLKGWSHGTSCKSRMWTPLGKQPWIKTSIHAMRPFSTVLWALKTLKLS